MAGYNNYDQAIKDYQPAMRDVHPSCASAPPLPYDSVAHDAFAPIIPPSMAWARWAGQAGLSHPTKYAHKDRGQCSAALEKCLQENNKPISIVIRRKKSTLPPSTLAKVCFSSLNSKTKQNTSITFKSVHLTFLALL
jgi:hypothetical protein